jgi:hypothetical protein
MSRCTIAAEIVTPLASVATLLVALMRRMRTPSSLHGFVHFAQQVGWHFGGRIAFLNQRVLVSPATQVVHFVFQILAL